MARGPYRLTSAMSAFGEPRCPLLRPERAQCGRKRNDRFRERGPGMLPFVRHGADDLRRPSRSLRSGRNVPVPGLSLASWDASLHSCGTAPGLCASRSGSHELANRVGRFGRSLDRPTPTAQKRKSTAVRARSPARGGDAPRGVDLCGGAGELRRRVSVGLATTRTFAREQMILPCICLHGPQRRML